MHGNMEYKIEDVSLTHLTRNYNAYYTEHLIQNNTKDNIILIDSSNNKTVIPPVSMSQLGRESVIVWFRTTTNPTVDHSNNKIPIMGKQIILQKYDLNTDGGCYINELNIVLCTENASISACHPRSSITYLDATHDALEQLTNTLDNAPTIKITANDPDNRYNKLYTVIGDMNIEIPVTNIYGEAVLNITYANKGECKSYNITLDDFFNGELDVVDLHNVPLTFITTNKAKATRYAKDYKRVPQSEVDDLLKRAELKSAKDNNALKSSYESDILTKASEIKRLKEQVKIVTTERDDINRLNTELKAAIDANNILRENDVKIKELDNKHYISDNNVNISNNDQQTAVAKRQKEETEAKFKLWHLILAAAIPTVTVVGMKAYDSYMKSRPQDLYKNPMKLFMP